MIRTELFKGFNIKKFDRSTNARKKWNGCIYIETDSEESTRRLMSRYHGKNLKDDNGETITISLTSKFIERHTLSIAE